jgi:hypothetical protein
MSEELTEDDEDALFNDYLILEFWADILDEKFSFVLA